MNAFASASYWEQRYASGGNSGAGSRGRLLAYKAAFLDGFMAGNAIRDVIDLGCGDGTLLALIHPPVYRGVDVSPTVLARCVSRFRARPELAFMAFSELAGAPPAQLALSIDVIFHLVEDAIFEAYMTQLFAMATRYVVVYASNCDRTWPAAHVRHRNFAAASRPGWRLAAHLPNPYPFDPADPDGTSFADFFVYARPGAACTIGLPATS